MFGPSDYPLLHGPSDYPLLLTLPKAASHCCMCGTPIAMFQSAITRFGIPHFPGPAHGRVQWGWSPRSVMCGEYRAGIMDMGMGAGADISAGTGMDERVRVGRAACHLLWIFRPGNSPKLPCNALSCHESAESKAIHPPDTRHRHMPSSHISFTCIQNCLHSSLMSHSLIDSCTCVLFTRRSIFAKVSP